MLPKEKHVVLPHLKKAKLFCIRETVNHLKALRSNASEKKSDSSDNSSASPSSSSEEPYDETTTAATVASASSSSAATELENVLQQLKRLKPDTLWKFWQDTLAQQQQQQPQNQSSTPTKTTTTTPSTASDATVSKMIVRRTTQLLRKASVIKSPTSLSSSKKSKTESTTSTPSKTKPGYGSTGHSEKGGADSNSGDGDKGDDNNKNYKKEDRSRQRQPEPASFFTDSLAALDKKREKKRKRAPSENLPVEELEGRKRKRAERAERFRHKIDDKKKAKREEDLYGYSDSNSSAFGGRSWRQGGGSGDRTSSYNYNEGSWGREGGGDRGVWGSQEKRRKYSDTDNNGSGAATMAPPPVPRPKKERPAENLHPSWAAKRALKEKISISDTPSGTHMVFD